jgi:MYXO-CTERM domain-containing protein
VAGSEGTCVAAKAGTIVAGSCSGSQACDGNGNCLSGNGQACTAAATCASGFCADGVCCNSACTGTCASCNLPGQAGKCSPYAAGTDPQNECGKGTGVCKSTCDGVGSCAFPQAAVPCASCTVCNGQGTCSQYDPYCAFTGGAGGSGGNFGGSGGYTTSRGGSGGFTTSFGGSGGFSTNTGGSGATTSSRGGNGGFITGGIGGFTTSRGGSGGSLTGGSGGNSVTGGTIVNSGGRIGTGGGIGTGGTIGTGGGIGPGGSGGSGGKADGGSPKGGTTGGILVPDGGFYDGITEARLHRSGCSCELGRPGDRQTLLWTAPLLILGAAWVRRRRHFRSGTRTNG